VDEALAEAVLEAARAHEWDVVRALLGELGARRGTP
jgi:hypothetical protein